jgi:hypothetical protein
VVMVYRQFALLTGATAVTFRAATNRTSTALLFEASFIFGEAQPLFHKRTGPATTCQTSAAPILPTNKGRKLID